MVGCPCAHDFQPSLPRPDEVHGCHVALTSYTISGTAAGLVPPQLALLSMWQSWRFLATAYAIDVHLRSPLPLKNVNPLDLQLQTQAVKARKAVCSPQVTIQREQGRKHWWHTSSLHRVVLTRMAGELEREHDAKDLKTQCPARRTKGV